jgi:hypothetical protein
LYNPKTTCLPARTERDERLWNLLPAIDTPYDCHSLSEAETQALIEAFTDGFGSIYLSSNTTRSLLPTSVVRSGLLNHVIYSRMDWPGSYSQEDLPGRGIEFDQEFPLGFHLDRLEIYFQNQLNRFRVHEGPIDFSDGAFAERACQWLYQKPWYEFHALDCLAWIKATERHARQYTGPFQMIFYSGKLGRLVEQYYWRFRFERSVTTGEGARKGASAGGKAKAAREQIKHSMWQDEASKIWAHRPDLNKNAVAEIIRKNRGEAVTAKHIARYIVHP